jgi:hypothetical protein
VVDVIVGDDRVTDLRQAERAEQRHDPLRPRGRRTAVHQQRLPGRRHDQRARASAVVDEKNPRAGLRVRALREQNDSENREGGDLCCHG